MTQRHLKPAEGRIVKDPATHRPLRAEGEWRELDAYWRRRLKDGDVVDITTRAVLGVLNPDFNVFPNNRVGDGANANDAPYRETFPYVGPAHSGVNSRHVDPGEPGCLGVCP